MRQWVWDPKLIFQQDHVYKMEEAETYLWPTSPRKRLSITNPQGSANQPHRDMPAHAHEVGYYSKQRQRTGAGEDVETEPCALVVVTYRGTIVVENRRAACRVKHGITIQFSSSTSGFIS